VSDFRSSGTGCCSKIHCARSISRQRTTPCTAGIGPLSIASTPAVLTVSWMANRQDSRPSSTTLSGRPSPATVGDDHEPRQFATYAACAIALIGRLPGTLADRSIPIALQRRSADEPIAPLRADRATHLDVLARKAARWAADHADEIRAADPAMPAGLVNRAADNWRGPLAIADVAGGEWPERARAACAALAGTIDDDQSVGVLALGDIRDAFTVRNVDRIASAELIDTLKEIEGRPWAEWRGGKALTTNGLARLLKPFNIAPENIRVGTRVVKGYFRERFEEAFVRYLGERASEPLHRYNADGGSVSETLATATPGAGVAVRQSQKPALNGNCSAVAIADPLRAPNRRASVNDLSAILRHPSAAPAEHARFCDYCRRGPGINHPVELWDWNGRKVALHPRCEVPWADRERAVEGG